MSISPQTKPHQQIVYSVRDIKISPKFGEMKPNFVKITMGVGRVGYYFSLKVKYGCISAQKLETERSKSFPASISLQTKAIRSYFRVPGT